MVQGYVAGRNRHYLGDGGLMAIQTIRNNDGSWAMARAVETGHFAVYFPNARILRLYDPNGGTVAETGVPEGVRDFDPYISPSGEVHVLFSSFNNDVQPWPWKRWTTGAFVRAGGPTPPPTGADNASLVAQIRALLDQIR